jgi:hypothetical protein
MADQDLGHPWSLPPFLRPAEGLDDGSPCVIAGKELHDASPG